MGSPILSLAQQALAELGLTNPGATTLVNATDDQSKQILALLLRVGDKVMRKGTWPQLESEWLVEIGYPVTAAGDLIQGSRGISNATLPQGSPVTAGTWAVIGEGISPTNRVAQVYDDGTLDLTEPATITQDAVALTFIQDTFALPDDVLAVTDRTGWDRGRRWMLEGPLLATEDQALRSGVIPSAPRWKFRISGRKPNLIVRPPPSGPTTLVFEYLTKNWILDASGASIPAFTADTNTVVFDDDVMVTGLKYLFFRARGFEYGGLKADFDHALYTSLAQSKPRRVINLSRLHCEHPRMIGLGNVQDGDYPGYQQ